MPCASESFCTIAWSSSTNLHSIWKEKDNRISKVRGPPWSSLLIHVRPHQFRGQHAACMAVPRELQSLLHLLAPHLRESKDACATTTLHLGQLQLEVVILAILGRRVVQAARYSILNIRTLVLFEKRRASPDVYLIWLILDRHFSLPGYLRKTTSLNCTPHQVVRHTPPLQRHRRSIHRFGYW